MLRSGAILTGLIIGGVGVLNYYVFLPLIQDELIHQVITYLCYSFFGIGLIFILVGLISAKKSKK